MEATKIKKKNLKKNKKASLEEANSVIDAQELAQVTETIQYANATPLATETSSLPHFALAQSAAADSIVTGSASAMSAIPTWAYVAAGVAVIGAGAGMAQGSSSSSATPAAVKPDYTLQLLHFSDGEAGSLASTTASKMAALVDKFEDEYTNSITLSGGDNFIPGPFLSAGTDSSIVGTLNKVTGSTLKPTSTIPMAAVDIAMMNAIGVEASALGNHDFDLGSKVLAEAFAGSKYTKPANFTYITSNLDFSGDAYLKPIYVDTTATAGIEMASSLAGKIAPSAILEEGGHKIGLVGATTQVLEKISSPTGTEVKGFPTGLGPNGEINDMDLLAKQLQPVIDDLIAQGVNKIMLLTHLQSMENEKLLATKLHGIDVILSAGSNTRLGDADDKAVAFPGHANNFKDTYPVVTKDADGKTTLIVNTDNEYTYLGRLIVDFDKNGNIIADSLASHTATNGAYASTDENVAKAWGATVDKLDTTAYADGTRGGTVKTLTNAVSKVIETKDGIEFGYSKVYLEGETGFVRAQETNLGNLSADANAYAAREGLGSSFDSPFLISFKNGGGIRAQIGTIAAAPNPDGSVDKLPVSDYTVSQLDVENSLRFNNQLMMFETTAEGLKNILEYSVAAGTMQGRFPQIGGLSFSWDPDFASGSRVMDISLTKADGTKVGLYDEGIKINSDITSIKAVTINYIANGGDGYTMKENGDNFQYLLEDASGTITLSSVLDESQNFTDSAVISQYTTAQTHLLGEQTAFGTYMQDNHGTLGTAYNAIDTSMEFDTRIQNLNFVANSTVI